MRWPLAAALAGPTPIGTLALALALVLVSLPGCARRAGQSDAGEPPRVRAALASITVENRTGERLRIEFRPAAGSATVAIGAVAPAATQRLAPVPALEPLVLSARTAQGGTFELAPRTFAIDEEWHWVIPPETVFR